MLSYQGGKLETTLCHFKGSWMIVSNVSDVLHGCLLWTCIWPMEQCHMISICMCFLRIFYCQVQLFEGDHVFPIYMYRSHVCVQLFNLLLLGVFMHLFACCYIRVVTMNFDSCYLRILMVTLSRPWSTNAMLYTGKFR